MNNSYEDIMLLVQALGRQPVSLLGKDYTFIFDHVRRIYEQGVVIPSTMYGGGEYGCTKFTFYKEKPTVKFADVYNDHLNLLGRWIPKFTPNSTKSEKGNFFYAESNDGDPNNKSITNAESNLGTASGQFSSSFQNLGNCDLIKKTNENFQNGMFNTLIARFHTNSMDSRNAENPTQTAITKKYGMSHGRNLLKITPDEPNGYNNPYCRVWTYHHQYHRMVDAIRPFGDANSEAELESLELSGDFDTVGFRTLESKKYNIKGGSERLDTHGVLNYDNGFVNIAPTAKVKDYFEGKEDDKNRKTVSVKKCMFSIENLAWRDNKAKADEFEPYGLSAEQRGPLGGRIMWFPPYDITFNENVRVKWNPNEFIGRGENIYTYTNTERNGNLSFTIVIDHPSILDYWTGHDAPRGDLKNQGVELLPGNSGGVDERNNQEQTLLRFFAGCDILSAKPHTYRSRANKVDTPPEEPVKNDIPQPNPTEPDEAKPTSKTLYCFAFYPNNYSGKNDGSIINPIHYLLNGIGTQMCITDPLGNPVKKEELAVDMGYTPTVKSIEGTSYSGYGGYEMRPSKGISVVTEPLEEYYDALNDSVLIENEKIEFLTNKHGEGVTAFYNPSSVAPYEPSLIKIIGSSALLLSAAKDKSGNLTSYVTKQPYEWYRKRWYYRVDNDTTNQKLNGGNNIKNNHLDTKSYQYNSKGIYGSAFIKSEFGIDIGDNDDVVSLTDMYVALEGDSAGIFSGLYTDEKVKLIQKIKEKGKITNITFYGHASSQGNNASAKVNATRNNSLAKNRALTFQKWMNDNGFPEINNSKYESSNGVQKGGDKNNVNDPVTKFWRSASVKIEYELSEATSAKKENSEAQIKDGNIATDENGKPLNKVDKVTNKNTQKLISPGNLNTARDWLYNTEQGRELLNNGYWEEEDVVMANGNTVRMKVHKNVEPWNFKMSDAERILGKNFTDEAKFDYDDSYKQLGEKSGVVKRYDNEGEFFQLLEKESPFMHHLITDKIKYFDPAYHAISPEGFNARLTFLHQCTRQGATIGNSDYNTKTAWNLAFGRPPVCVLRLGDFYYTKILINGLTINYENPTWDLNPEGIGVMPMFAKVNLDFTFIGGSDLAGPIARLQNAVSFNYYANTSVYDNRAERVEYDPAKTGKEIAYKPYNYPNGNGRSTADNMDTEDL